jgi:DNA/RNA-binding domain of Phe-tRNA-synthetase-like protein
VNWTLIIDEELETVFPGLRVVELAISDLIIDKSDPRLEELKRTTQSRLRERIRGLEEVKNQPMFRAYRDFYWKIGIDPTKNRPSTEALVRRILGGKDLPTINTLVDSYNLASVDSFVSIAAFDSSAIDMSSLAMRRARTGEPFLGIGMPSPMVLRGVEVVIEDKKNGQLIAVYPYRDAEASKVTEKTKGVLLMMCGVPSIPDHALENARSLCEKYVSEFCRD